MNEMFEFASPQWLSAVCKRVEEHLAQSHLEGVSYVLGEMFTGVPDRLNPAGEASIGWTICIRDGVTNCSPTVPPPDADQVNIADWRAVEPLAHHVFGADPERDAEVVEIVARLEADGTVQRRIRRPQPLKLAEAWKPVHNLVVSITSFPKAQN